MDHILLTTTIRHLNERVQISNGWAQNVTFSIDIYRRGSDDVFALKRSLITARKSLTVETQKHIPTADTVAL